MADERFLVTGGTGCIGSWVVRALVREGVPVTVLASSGNVDRLELILLPRRARRRLGRQGRLTDVDALETIARDARVTSVIHLAALQLPLCAADPINGARVNVQGTAAMFELVRRLELGRLVYASSAAVYGPARSYAAEVVGPDAPLAPTSHYGVFKMANEQAARVYADAWGIASIGLRPHSAYGPGCVTGA